MAIIKLKRITTDFVPATHKLFPGELGVTGKSLLYGSMYETPDGEGLVSARQLATQNFDNTFSAANNFGGINTFQYTTNDADHSLVFKDSGGTEKYYLYGGRLATGLTSSNFNNADLVNKAYVDARVQGLAIKDSVVMATTDDIALTGDPGNIDGIELVTDQRILVKNQSTNTENGIYIVNTSGAWTRATDSPVDDLPNAFVFVEQGTNQKDTGWVCTTDSGSTAIVWTQFSGAGAYTADEVTLTRSGTEFAIKFSTAAATNDYFKYSAAGVVPRSYAEVKTDLSLNNVTNESKATMFTSPTFTGTTTASGDVNIGTGDNTWFMDGTRTGFRFYNSTGYYAELKALTAELGGNKTIAYTTDIPAVSTEAETIQGNGASAAITFTGLATTDRTKTVRDANDTILELGGTYSPTGTWTFDSSKLRIDGSSTGYTTVASANSSSTNYTITLPATSGTVALTTSNITGTAAGLSTTLVVGSGGTGTATAPTAGGIIYGASESAYGSTGAGTAGQYLISGGAGTPQWTNLPAYPTQFSITASSDILAATGGNNSTQYNAETSLTAGKFYRNAANPTATTGTEVNAIKYEGWMYATQFEGMIDGGTSW